MSNNEISLAERLGYDASQKLVIISCDDLGSCHAANMGVYSAIRNGIASCASVMVPAPWARHAADMYEGEDIGVHITLNAEHPLYRWGPITHAPSLLSGDGGFPRNTVMLVDNHLPFHISQPYPCALWSLHRQLNIGNSQLTH